MHRKKQNKSYKQTDDDSHTSNIWEDFTCPKYVRHTCPRSNKLYTDSPDIEERSQPDISYTLRKLEELISDPVTKDSVPRICRLLHDYLYAVGDKGYAVKDLPAVMKILEFLAWEVKTIEDYEIHLDRMLELCNLPPLLERTSENLVSTDIMEQYFTLLGYLLAILPTKWQVLKVYDALHSLLISTKPTNVAAVKVECRRRAMENSRLSITIVELSEASYPDMYPKILELIFLLTSVSYACCYKMLEAGILNTLLIRMDLPYATQLRCTRPPNAAIDGDEYSQETTFFMMNILWCLMKSILPPKKLPDTLKNIPPVKCAMWGLRYAFKRQIYYGQRRNISVKVRNEIAMLILVGLVTIPSWNLVSSGIADDVILLLAGIEAGNMIIWCESVTFRKTDEDMFLQKILLLIVTHLARVDACITLMVKRKLMRTILELVNPDIEESQVTWNVSQFWQLSECAIIALSVLAPKMPKEFIKYKGTTRLWMILEWCINREPDEQFLMNYTKAICSIVIKSDSVLRENFRECGITFSLIKLIFYILDLEKFTMRLQRILTFLLVAVKTLTAKKTFFQETYAEQNVRLCLELLFRCLYQKHNEFQVDQRLLLGIGSYIWNCIVCCPTSLVMFIEHGAVYIILDVIEIAPYPTRCLFLGVLTDMCDHSFCGQYLCTWRGTDKSRGLMSLLAMVWREEEIRLGVKRKADGSMEDVELPQMGVKQWQETYRGKLTADVSPTILDMIASVRSKIYSIRRIIERDSDMYKIAKEHYKIFLNDLPTEDRITMSCVDFYFRLKLGQLWIEIGKYLEHVGITPLSMDGQVMFLMIQRHRSWGMFIKEKQRKLMLSIKDADETKEKEEYAKIRDSLLAPTLDAFDELDYIRRSTDRAYMLRVKDKQRKQINAALRFPADADNEHCRRTFQETINVTATFDQHYILKERPFDENLTQANISLFSLSDSNFSHEPVSLIPTSDTSMSNRCLSAKVRSEENT